MTKTVLIVEDSEDFRELLGMKLRRMGLEVLEARSGLDAVRIFTAHLDCGKFIDGVLLDISLPLMNGIGAARVMRCTEQNMNTLMRRSQIGFLSAVTDQFEETNAFEEVGATLRLQKPYDMGDLDAQVRTWLGLE